MIETEEIVLPFLKWAGGKRWLAGGIHGLNVLPSATYYEPFLGSGAMFFSLRPRTAVLSDRNAALIETYQALQSDWQKVEHALRNHARRHSSEYYYAVRSTRYRTPHTRAAQFIYLNRTCWNGLYRVNKNGWFNVPKGTKTSVILNEDDFLAVSKCLASATLLSVDFEQVVDMATEGDVVFADPPYTVRHQHNGFVKYNETLFSWEDQIRLRDAVKRAKARGATVLVTNADHQSIRGAYRDGFSMKEVCRYSAISGATGSRGIYPELLIS